MDFNVRDYQARTFIRKQDLREQGPRRVTVKAVEEADGLPGRDGKPARKELVLVFTDGSKLALRARINQDTMADLHGERTRGWIGKAIDLYFDASVMNPFGGEQGGIRIRRPDAPAIDELGTYVSDLDHEEEEPPAPQPPAKGNGGLATRPRPKGPRA